MESKIIKWLLAALAVVIGISIYLGCTLSNVKKDRSRLSSNQEALFDSVHHYKTVSGKNAAEVKTLTLKASELKRNCGDLSLALKDMGIKLKRAQQISQAATGTELFIQTITKDSLIYVDTAYHKVQSITWADPWVNVNGILDQRVLSMNIQSRDTLITVLHRIPHKFLFFRWGCKEVRQSIRSSNPHTSIVYSNSVLLSK